MGHSGYRHHFASLVGFPSRQESQLNLFSSVSDSLAFFGDLWRAHTCVQELNDDGSGHARPAQQFNQVAPVIARPTYCPNVFSRISNKIESPKFGIYVQKVGTTLAFLGFGRISLDLDQEST